MADKEASDSDDVLCVHPVFSEVYRVKRDDEMVEQKLVIYPYGSEIDGKDIRKIR